MLLKSQKVQINVRENLIGNQIQTTRRHRNHWVHDNEWKQTHEINTSQTTIIIATGAGVNIAAPEWYTVIVSYNTPIVLSIINIISTLIELQHVVVILW